jgi:hypothetical protein
MPTFVSAVAVLEEAQRRHPEALEAVVAILDKDGRTHIHYRCSPSQMAYVASKLLAVAGSE